MSFLPPWLTLFLVLLLLGALAALVLHRGLKFQSRDGVKAVWAMNTDVQTRAHRRIQQQHLSDLDCALAEGHLNLAQHAVVRDEALRQLLDDVALAQGSEQTQFSVQWAWMVVALVVLSGLSYVQLGASQMWWPLPLSQRVQISAIAPAQLVEQTRRWQQTTQSRPDDAEAWLTLARLHAAQNEHTPAEQALARVLALSPEPDLWVERAQMKALSAGGVYIGEPWQWIQNVLREQPLHLNALVLAGSAALSEKRHTAAQSYWQQALALVPAESEAAQGLQQALAQVAELGRAIPEGPAEHTASFTASTALSSPSSSTAKNTRVLIQGQVSISAQVQSQMGPAATLFVYALAEDGTRRPVAIWRGTPTSWPVAFALSDNMGMGAPLLLSDLPQVRLVARISRTGAAKKQAGDFQVELPGVKIGENGIQGVVLNITGHTP